MSRAVPPWVGKTPDTPAPPRVRLRVWDTHKGRCHRCHRKINAGEKWTLEHITALINGGENSEWNLALTCSWCLPIKNAEDVKEKSKTYKRRAKHLGVERKKHRWGYGKDDPMKKKVGGEVVRR